MEGLGLGVRLVGCLAGWVCGLDAGLAGLVFGGWVSFSLKKFGIILPVSLHLFFYAV